MNELLGRFVVILVGIVLIPIVYAQAVDANLGGTTAVIVALIPTFFALVVLISTIKGLV
jgi:hypothetical protein